MKDIFERQWAERTVKVDRKKLIETLKSNREKHQKDYKESMEGYIDLAQKTLETQAAYAKRKIDDNVAMLKTKIDRFDPEDPVQDTVVVLETCRFVLKVPQDHTKSYDVAIQMAEWEVDSTIELTQSQFQCFVLDDWEWKEEFVKLSGTYSKHK